MSVGLALAVFRRELLRFKRQPARIVAAIATPALLWIFLGSGVGDSVRPANATSTYAAFVLPGMMTLVAVFTSIFASIAVIEDRNEGWLQAVLVSPAPRWTIAAGRIAGGAVVAALQAIVLLPMAPLVGDKLTFGEVMAIVLAIALTSVAMTAVGLAAAWRTATTSSFHAVMNLLLMPMWLLSGAFFPADGASPWLGWLMRINPLTWCTSAIRAPLIGEIDWPALEGATAFAVIAFAVAVMIIASRKR